MTQGSDRIAHRPDIAAQPWKERLQWAADHGVCAVDLAQIVGVHQSTVRKASYACGIRLAAKKSVPEIEAQGAGWVYPDEPTAADCRRLWAAVIIEYWATANSPRKSGRPHEIKAARRWFGGAGFREVCDLAGINADRVLAVVKSGATCDRHMLYGSVRGVKAVAAVLAALAVTGLASPSDAAPAARWSGAGIHACDGRCGMDWAIGQLPAGVRAQLRAAIAAHPEPSYIPVHDGDVISHMAYWRDGAARMDARGTVVERDVPAAAWGWRIDGYAFVKLGECQNWALVLDARVASGGMSLQRAARVADVVAMPASPWPSGRFPAGGFGFGGSSDGDTSAVAATSSVMSFSAWAVDRSNHVIDVALDGGGCGCPPDPVPFLPSVPAPAGGGLLLTVIGVLAACRRWCA
ncbi:hypothetical protein [Paracoccus sp. (in: a-proteobacteria)]|uniref:hypothetical protein n=1 Tax=Paracoccus sp. TaxID=267 RepID=UPI003A87434A